MSIDIGYTEEGELFIRRDSDTLKWSREMRVDVVVDTPSAAPAGAPAEAAPPAVERPLSVPPGAVPEPTRSKSVRWPKPPPGVMAIIQARPDSATEPLKWSFVDLDRFHPAISMPLIQLQGTSPHALRQQLKSRPQSLGNAPEDTFVTVEVQASRLPTGSISLNALESLVNNSTLGLTGIRLVFTPDPDPTP